ncbi:MAG: hypothetical protein Q7P63_12310 [Verrucomicrobiota bacterium JB022]|nr:hypothetical protein [Verrucomicrobiota bacterium JB022]
MTVDHPYLRGQQRDDEELVREYISQLQSGRFPVMLARDEHHKMKLDTLARAEMKRLGLLEKQGKQLGVKEDPRAPGDLSPPTRELCKGERIQLTEDHRHPEAAFTGFSTERKEHVFSKNTFRTIEDHDREKGELKAAGQKMDERFGAWTYGYATTVDRLDGAKIDKLLVSDRSILKDKEHQRLASMAAKDILTRDGFGKASPPKEREQKEKEKDKDKSKEEPKNIIDVSNRYFTQKAQRVIDANNRLRSAHHQREAKQLKKNIKAFSKEAVQKPEKRVSLEEKRSLFQRMTSRKSSPSQLRDRQQDQDRDLDR